MNLVQVLLALALLVWWLWLLNSWRLRTWRAVAWCGAGTITILAAGILPNPVRGLVQAGTWLLVSWVLVIRPELVSVIAPEEYEYVNRYAEIVRRIAGRKTHRPREIDPEAYLIAFEADVRSLEALAAPPAWAAAKFEAVRELDRRLLVMKLGVTPSPEALALAHDRWDEVGRQFSEVMKARAGFWTGWPHLFRRPDRGV